MLDNFGSRESAEAGAIDQVERVRKAGQKSGFQGRYFSVDFSRTDHAKVAEAFGVKAWTVREPGELKGALAKALEADGPTLVDVLAQPLQDARAPVSEWVA